MHQTLETRRSAKSPRSHTLVRLIVKSDKLVTGQTSVLDGGSKGAGTVARTRKKGGVPSLLFDSRCTPEVHRTGSATWCGPCWCILAQAGAVLFSQNISPPDWPSSEANALLVPGTSLSPLPLFKATCSLM